MNTRKLKKLKREIRSLRAGSGNVHRHQLVSLAMKFGRKEFDRGKEPTYVSSNFPDLRPISIPSHPGTMKRYTVESILDQLEGDDVVRWQQTLEIISTQNPHE